MILFFLACAPRIIRYPGPIIGLGQRTRCCISPVCRAKTQKGISNSPEKGLNLAKAARSFVGAKQLQVGDRTYGYHCSGFISAAFAKAGLSVEGSTKHLYSQAKKEGVLSTKPQIGSIVFFDNTYDANKNGTFDDPLSHVAIVEKMYDDGRVSMLHLGSRGIVPLTLNLRQPDQHKDMDGILHNSFFTCPNFSKRQASSIGWSALERICFWDVP